MIVVDVPAVRRAYAQQRRLDASLPPPPPPRKGPNNLDWLGLPVPPLTPQTVGCYFTAPEGRWPRDRTQLVQAVSDNLGRLNDTPEGSRRDLLNREITLHWHCLSGAEKGMVLESLGTRQAELLGDTGQQAAPDLARTPARDWLDHTTVNMKPEIAQYLLRSCGLRAQQTLKTPFALSIADGELKTMLDDRFAHLSNTMPLDHGFDYGGFLWDNNRQVGKLPEDVAKNLSVCIVGAGPSGIVAADLLNRLGVQNFKVLEQADHIGGRMAVQRWDNGEGQPDTLIHPGAMRFHTTGGNAFWSYAKHYDLPHVPFPNSSSVSTSYIIGNRVVEAKPGEAPSDPVMRKVADDVRKAMAEPLLEPFSEARKAGDTARLRTLWSKATDRFDQHTFRSGLTALLADKGIEWGEEEWQTFGATGIGVGGYEGYYGTGFLEELRFLVDGRLEGHRGLVDGADAPLQRIIDDEDDLPEGAQSLAAREAIKLGVEVTGIKRVDGKYHVSSVDRQGTPTTGVYDELFFAAGPSVARRLGLTGPQEGSESLMTDELAAALEAVNDVHATKMAIRVAVGQTKTDVLPQGVRLEDLPGNVQSGKLFQQSYVVPPRPGSDQAVIYPSYTLGTNAGKVVGMTGQQQLDLYVKTLRDIASREPDDPSHQKLATLADIVEQNKDRLSYTHWGLEPHFGGAFKMDAPYQNDNTKRLFGALLDLSPGAIFINEKQTAEGGFASGAVASATNGTQKFVVQHGGTLPPNSPFHQELL